MLPMRVLVLLVPVSSVSLFSFSSLFLLRAIPFARAIPFVLPSLLSLLPSFPAPPSFLALFPPPPLPLVSLLHFHSLLAPPLYPLLLIRLMCILQRLPRSFPSPVVLLLPTQSQGPFCRISASRWILSFP